MTKESRLSSCPLLKHRLPAQLLGGDICFIMYMETNEEKTVRKCNGGIYSSDWKCLLKFAGIDADGNPVVEHSVDKRCEVISPHAFEGCQYISKVILPSGVKKIGENAFADCTSLLEVEGADGLETIDKSAFCHCISLREFVISDEIMEIAPHTFHDCRGLKKVTGLKSVFAIGDYAFYGCTDLEEITFPIAYVEVGVSAFEDCDSLPTETKDIIIQWREITKGKKDDDTSLYIK